MRYALYATPQHAALPEAARAFIAYDHHYQHQPHQQWLQQLLQGRPVVFEASDLFSLQEAARSGLGAVVLPTFVADSDPDLVVFTHPHRRANSRAVAGHLSRSGAVRCRTRSDDFSGGYHLKKMPIGDIKHQQV
jgi:DNA-binding transcriptional LysR family regulator